MEEWHKIPSFPDYSISSEGRVFSDRYDRLITPSLNSGGIQIVGLRRDKKLHKRSVAVLVAKAFLPTLNPSFDTPINLDGNRSNNSMFNLMWRPRWFAIDYVHQFDHPPRGYDVPIEDVETGEVFPNSWEAAIRHGLLEMEIVFAMMKNIYVWPTYQFFRVV